MLAQHRDDLNDDDRLADLLAVYADQLTGNEAAAPEVSPPRELDARFRAASEVLDTLSLLWRRGRNEVPLPVRDDSMPSSRPTPLPSTLATVHGDGSGSLELVKLGRFIVERELGRGGFGVVYLAWDPRRGRRVAVKVPRLDAVLDKDLRRRFREEAKAALRLEHPHILPALEVAEVGAICCIVSPYCEGKTLESWLAERTKPIPFPTIAQLFVDLAEALQYAHDQGILHRDLKPANILLTKAGPTETEGDGGRLHARIADFGLATAPTRPNNRTDSRLVVGTPPYLSPEQAGGPNELCPASDFFALGVILYEMLTGKAPFVGSTSLATLQNICLASPVPPRRLRPDVPPALERICLRCLEKAPSDRYRRGADLAEDLRRFQRGESVSSRKRDMAERVRRQLIDPEHARRAGRYMMAHGWVMALWCLVIVGLSLAFPREVAGVSAPSLFVPVMMAAWLGPLILAGSRWANVPSLPWKRLGMALSAGYLGQIVYLRGIGAFQGDLLDGNPHLFFDVLTVILAVVQCVLCAIPYVGSWFERNPQGSDALERAAGDCRSSVPR